MDAIKMHDRAVEFARSVVATVDTGQFSRPTPCPDFDVKALINHLIDANNLFVEVAGGASDLARRVLGDHVDTDASAAFDPSAVAVIDAWHDPALLGRIAHMPFGDVPGDVAIGIHFTESLVHGWDLLKATGQPTELDPELVAFAWQQVKDLPESFRAAGGPFGAAVDPPAAASDTERLVAWLGRTP